MLLQGTYTERHRKLHSRKYIVAVGIAEESTMEYALPGGIPGKRHFFSGLPVVETTMGKENGPFKSFGSHRRISLVEKTIASYRLSREDAKILSK